MFDIKEYFDNKISNRLIHFEEMDDQIIENFNTEIPDKNKLLYEMDKYKTEDHSITILYPTINFFPNQKLLLKPNTLKFNLSFYPQKKDLKKIDTILIKPKYIATNNIELMSIFIQENKLLVIYLFTPHLYDIPIDNSDVFSNFKLSSLEKITNKNFIKKSKIETTGRIKAHPLWYLLQTVSDGNNNKIEKFFINNKQMDWHLQNKIEETSLFFEEHGY